MVERHDDHDQAAEQVPAIEPRRPRHGDSRLDAGPVDVDAVFPGGELEWEGRAQAVSLGSGVGARMVEGP